MRLLRQEKSDGSTVCVSGDQLANALSGGSSQSQVQISSPTPPTISGTTTPPSINIQGNNPATINVGDTYTDLGAIVHDNQGHDLSYRTFVNGVVSGNILIDTSQAATDTIDYVATDTWANTSTSTRRSSSRPQQQQLPLPHQFNNYSGLLLFGALPPCLFLFAAIVLTLEKI